MYINFQQNWANTQPCTQMYLQKNRKLHEFATTNKMFLKSTLSDMQHC